jgi:hypothetical protein
VASSGGMGVELIFALFKNCSKLEIKFKYCPVLKNAETLHAARFGDEEQLSPLAQLEIPTPYHGIIL